MNCQTVNQFLLQDQKHEIPAQTRQEIDRHLKECAHCRNNAYLTQMENEVLNESFSVPPISPDFIQRTMQLLPHDLYGVAKSPASTIPTEKTKKTVPHFHRACLGAVASFLLLFGLGFYFQQDLSSFLPGQYAAENSNAVVVSEQSSPSLANVAALYDVAENSGNIETVTESSPNTEENGFENDEAFSSKPREDAGAVTESAVMKTALYEYNSAAAPNLVLASNDLETTSNPYQYAPASAYTSAVDAHYQASRSGGSSTEAQTTTLPDIVLSCLPEHFRLVDFSVNDVQYIFYYQDDSSNQQFNFEITPYDSSSSFINIHGDSAISKLITCGDITYQVTLTGTVPEEHLEQILDIVEIRPW